MRIDSQHPGYLQDDSRARDVDPVADYGFELPEVAPEFAPPLFVDGDICEEPSGPGVVGMAPFFGLDGVEALPRCSSTRSASTARPSRRCCSIRSAPRSTGSTRRGADFARVLIAEPRRHRPRPRRAPPAQSAPPSRRLVPPRRRASSRAWRPPRTGTPPQLGSDGVGLDPPGFDVRQPLVGADDVDYARIRRPVPAPEFLHAGDGIESSAATASRFAA